MKEKKEALCANCGWSGNALGLTNCPECHNELVVLEKEMKAPEPKKQEKYEPGQVKGDDAVNEILEEEM